jgi:hypothetical protein
VGDDYDYEGGVVRIVRKKNEIPTHHDDGEIVAEVDASPGTFYYLDAYDFVNGENYITAYSLSTHWATLATGMIPERFLLVFRMPRSPLT